jgi:hypothetical protein
VGQRALTKHVTHATWDDVPHLSEAQKAELLGSIPAYQRDARTKGIPQLGSGAIYPVPESEILCEPFEIPVFWTRCFALDVGWNRTAALWGAHDTDADIVYLTAEYYRGQSEPAVHAAAIRSRGDWIPGVIDPASRGRAQKDGQQLLSQYRDDLGLNLVTANNAVEAGLFACFQRMSCGRLKVFRTLPNWLTEFRLYRRDEKGAVVKKDDHLMDAMRYLVMSGLNLACVAPDAGEKLFGKKQRGVQTDYDVFA